MKVEEIIELFEIAEKEKEPYRERFLEYYRTYRGYKFEETDDDGNIKLERRKILPKAYSVIMSIVPKILRNKQRIQYIMKRPPHTFEDTNQVNEVSKRVEFQSELMNYVTQYQWRMGNFDYYYLQYLINLKIYGTAIAYLTSSPIVANKIDQYVVDPFEFYPAPGAKDPFRLKSCFRRWYVEPKELAKLIEMGMFGESANIKLDDLERMVKDDEEMADKMDAIEFDAGENATKGVEIIEYYDLDNIYTIINRERIIREAEHEVKFPDSVPFLITQNIPMPGEFWGISELEHLIDLILESTRIRALRMANLDMSVNQMTRIDPTKEVALQDLVIAPNQIIRAEEGALEFIKPPMLGAETYNEEDRTNNEIVEILGISDYSYPQSPARMETATAINYLTDSTISRFFMTLDLLSMSYLTPLGYWLMEWNKNNLQPMSFVSVDRQMTETQDLIIIDDDKLRDIRKDYDVVVTSGDPEVTNKQEFVQFIQTVLGIPELFQRIKPDKLLQQAFGMFKIPTFNLIKSEDEMMMEQQQQMAMMQQQGGGEQPPQPMPGGGAAGPPMDQEGEIIEEDMALEGEGDISLGGEDIQEAEGEVPDNTIDQQMIASIVDGVSSGDSESLQLLEELEQGAANGSARAQQILNMIGEMM